MASYKTYIGIGKVYVPNTLVGINNFTLSRKVNLNYGASWDASTYPFMELLASRHMNLCLITEDITQ